MKKFVYVLPFLSIFICVIWNYYLCLYLSVFIYVQILINAQIIIYKYTYKYTNNEAMLIKNEHTSCFHCLMILLIICYIGILKRLIRKMNSVTQKVQFPKIHRSLLCKITIDLMYFWGVYDINLWEKNLSRSMAYLCRTNLFKIFF